MHVKDAQVDLLLLLLLRLQIYHCVQLNAALFVFGITLRLLVIHFVVVFNKLRRLPAISVINSPWSVATECVALGSRTVHSTRYTQILAENPLPPPVFDAIVRGGGSPSEYYHDDLSYGKTRVVWLRDGEKILKTRLFILTEFTNVTDGRTDRHRFVQPLIQSETLLMSTVHTRSADTFLTFIRTGLKLNCYLATCNCFGAIAALQIRLRIDMYGMAG